MDLGLMKVQVDGVGSTTLVGVNTDNYPLKRGNCFSVFREEIVGGHGKISYKEYRVLNFNYENLEHLLESNIIQWPIDIFIYERDFALIHDIRIPEEYYQKHFCEVCCPEDLLPMPQRLALDRKTLRGEREVIKCDGFTMVRQELKPTMKKLDVEVVIAPDMVNLTGIDVDAEMVNAIKEAIAYEYRR